MKKKSHVIHKILKMPQLFREDLEAIEALIKKDLKPEGYKLETKSYEYDTIESVPKDAEAITEFHIQTNIPYININLSQNNAYIYASEDNLIVTGVIVKILEILENKERKMLYWLQNTAMWGAPAIFFLSSQMLIWSKEISSIRYEVLIGIIVLAAIWWVFSFYVSTHRFSMINFVYSKEKPNFFQRNKDQIILLIIGAILGAIFTTLISKLFQQS